MLGTVLYGPGDVRCEDVPEPTIVEPTDAIIRLAATCICGSDLWRLRGPNDVAAPMEMGHEYCGTVVEVGSAVNSVRPGQFVVGSFCLSDNTCPHCRLGFQSYCEQREFMTGAQAPLARVRSPTARWSQRRDARRRPDPACSPPPTCSAPAGTPRTRPGCSPARPRWLSATAPLA